MNETKQKMGSKRSLMVILKVNKTFEQSEILVCAVYINPLRRSQTLFNCSGSNLLWCFEL